MTNLYRFFYETRPDGMPQYLYVAAASKETAYKYFIHQLHILQGFNVSGPLKFYDYTPEGGGDLLGQVDSIEGTIWGGCPRDAKVVWLR